MQGYALYKMKQLYKKKNEKSQLFNIFLSLSSLSTLLEKSRGFIWYVKDFHQSITS